VIADDREVEIGRVRINQRKVHIEPAPLGVFRKQIAHRDQQRRLGPMHQIGRGTGNYFYEKETLEAMQDQPVAIGFQSPHSSRHQTTQVKAFAEAIGCDENGVLLIGSCKFMIIV
jgi:hypothetical protein